MNKKAGAYLDLLIFIIIILDVFIIAKLFFNFDIIHWIAQFMARLGI